MHIIPSDIASGHRELAELLAAGLYDDGEAAAVAVLLRTPALLGPHGIWMRTVTYEVERDDTIVHAGSLLWLDIVRDVDSGQIPATDAEAAAVRIAALLAGELGDALRALDAGMRRVVVDAVAHAAGLPEAAPDGDRPEGDGSEPVPPGVDGVPLARCMRCGRSYQPCRCVVREVVR